MTLRQYLFLMFATSAFCWFGWFLVVTEVDPMHGGWVALALFYLSLSLAVAGTLSIAGLAVRAWTRRHEAVSRHVMVSFRQAMLLAFLLDVALILQSRSKLGWGNLLLLIGSATLIELFLASMKTEKGLERGH